LGETAMSADGNAREDKLAIIEVIQNWALWRDGGDWERLRGAFHPEGTMTATWFSGPADEFIAKASAAWDAGVRGGHFIGGSSVRLNGDKALAETRITLLLRDRLDDTEVDVTCHGRFYDRFERHEGEWRIRSRHVIYEKDRIDPVTPGMAVKLDDATLRRFPEGYRHLAYVQTRNGLEVAADRPTLRSAELGRLYREGNAWLG
jgi:hypothetical protein